MEHTPEAAPEIIVWTETMDVDASPHESDDLMNIKVNAE